ncbi:FixH family protein [Paenibacillus woosongensis]|uniref:FixH family protein n=1 Tax=Paenibacillus woosongensis TaxID=307580 RepID=A0AA95L212_9BACL|nr:FixH family protein [Paenibacillus woosongensis]WHX50709.1 FixH family protein [Paenibacillus woosongensis]
MKRWTIACLVLMIVILAGCSSAGSQTGMPDGIPEIIDVQIQSEPEKLNPGEPARIQAKVTQGGEEVTDAKSVTFEVWLSGSDTHEMLEGTHAGNGVYSIDKTFEQDGVYNVIAHVTARDMHNMPRKQLIVGEVTEDEIEQAKDSLYDKSSHMD